MLNMKLKIGFLCVVALLMTACVRQMPRSEGPRIRPAKMSTSQTAEEATASQQTPLEAPAASVPELIQKAKALMAGRRFEESKVLLQKVSATSTLAPGVETQKTLLDAELALTDGEAKTAMRLLRRLDPASPFTETERLQYHVLLAKTQAALGNYFASSGERIYLSAYLLDKPALERQNNHEIWENLQKVPIGALQNEIGTLPPQNNPYSGWIHLAYITKRFQHDPAHLVKAVGEWRENFPTHPGNAFLTNRNPQNRPISIEPHHIALLLPLRGTLGPLARAVRDGFMTAYQMDKNKHKPKVSVIDTQGDKEISSAYQKAISRSADFIIGPLTKEGVLLLNQQNPEVPLMTLNKVPGSLGPNRYQFGLSPEDEARQAARRAWHKGYNHALVIALNNNWGQRVANAFKEEWELQGADLIDTVFFKSKNDLANPIRNLLHIDESQERAKSLRSILGGSIKYQPRRRQDIDVIFLASYAQQAKQIRPLLSYYYANDVPVYATSSIYGGHPMPTSDKDLNQIVFCDMPWILTPKKAQPKIHNTIKKLWPKSEAAYPRLYALGVDAYQLLGQMNRLITLPEIGYPGVTGELILNEDNQIQRDLTCATFSRGLPQALKS